MASFRFLILKFLLKLQNLIDNKVNGLAMKLNAGIHPKHRIMNYHQFFIENIEKGSKVLDIGCGIGVVAHSISKKAGKVIACDLNPKSINQAKKKFSKENIDYILADATNYDFKDNFDYIILSNVLEHIEDRQAFLNKLKPLTKYFLIRVPMINRSWLVRYKEELGIEYRTDPTHFIEYTLTSFKQELEAVKLKLLSYSVQFGEIWAKIGLK